MNLNSDTLFIILAFSKRTWNCKICTLNKRGLFSVSTYIIASIHLVIILSVSKIYNHLWFPIWRVGCNLGHFLGSIVATIQIGDTDLLCFDTAANLETKLTTLPYIIHKDGLLMYLLSTSCANILFLMSTWKLFKCTIRKFSCPIIETLNENNQVQCNVVLLLVARERIWSQQEWYWYEMTGTKEEVNQWESPFGWFLINSADTFQNQDKTTWV